MKNRWIAPVLLAGSLALAACAPTQSGADASASATTLPASIAPAAPDSPAPSQSSGPDYDY